MAKKPKILIITDSPALDSGMGYKAERICKRCGEKFWVYSHRLKRKNGGTFCSKSCNRKKLIYKKYIEEVMPSHAT